MTTKNIFISWSKERSLALANLLKTLLSHFPKFNAQYTTVMSTDIEKGKPWLDQLRLQINEADACIVCITPENVDSNWINFEVGALANKFEYSQIFPLLLDLDPSDINGPLNIYQGSEISKEGMATVLHDLNILDATEPIPEPQWQAFIEGVDDIRRDSFKYLFPEFESLFNRKTFNEPIEECSTQRWNERYAGIRETLAVMESRDEVILEVCPPGLVNLYKTLKNQMHGYAMDLNGQFIENREFEIRDTDGKLNIEPGLLKRVSNRFEKINTFRKFLVQNEHIPLLADAVTFQYLESFDERKRIIHNYEDQIKNDGFTLLEMHWPNLKGSPWILERVIYYMLREREADQDPSEDLIRTLIETTRTELEKANAKKGSLIPMHYTLRGLLESINNSSTVVNENIKSSILTVRR